MNSVAHPACGNAKHPAQLSTAQKADRRARWYIRFHAFQSEEKRDGRQEFKNSGVKNQGVRSNPRASARERFEKKLSLGGQRQVSQKLLTRMMRASSGKKLLPKFLSRSQESELRSQELQNGTADRP